VCPFSVTPLHDLLGPSKQVGLAEADVDGNLSGDDVADTFFLPNCLTMAGLQHTVDNLCKDVHASMSHWATYYEQLKSVEAFLRVEVRVSLLLGFRFAGRP
jgi:hypothetical protein